MPRFAYMTILVPVLILGGCKSKQTTAQKEAALDAALAGSIHQPAVNGAILAQHTLYPYHFDNQGAGLNSLGRRDLGVLAGRFKTTSGELNVRRGTASSELYDARVQAVLSALTEAGVDSSHVSIGDNLPGGDGLASAEVVVRIEATRKSSSSATIMGAGAAAGTKTGANQ